MRSGLFRSTPFRLTLILGSTFFLALIVAGFSAFSLIEHQLKIRLDQSITDSFNVIAQAYGDSDLADLVDSVNSHVSAAPDHQRIYALSSADNRLIAGNVTILPTGIGWKTFQPSALGIPESRSAIRTLIGSVNGNRLLVGESLAESNEIAGLALTSMSAAGIVVFMLVLATGIAVAVRAQRRLDGVANTMALVGHGELSARIPVGPRGDDIDALARQVNAALERLANLVEGMRQVSVNIAHDLKTPLNRLAITVESAINAEAAGIPVTPLLAQAEMEVRQINSTFDALLRIAQIEAGARRARFVRVQLATVLERIAEAYVDVADERGQQLQVSWQADLPYIDGDADLLTQLCANLIENSMRHGPAGVRIEVSANYFGGSVALTVADSGPGIPTEEHGKVFQRLYRVDRSRTTPGSGLGLSLVKAITDLHGAQISMADRRPGLRVAIAFPVVPPSQAVAGGHAGST